MGRSIQTKFLLPFSHQAIVRQLFTSTFGQCGYCLTASQLRLERNKQQKSWSPRHDRRLSIDFRPKFQCTTPTLLRISRDHDQKHQSQSRVFMTLGPCTWRFLVTATTALGLGQKRRLFVVYGCALYRAANLDSWFCECTIRKRLSLEWWHTPCR